MTSARGVQCGVCGEWGSACACCDACGRRECECRGETPRDDSYAVWLEDLARYEVDGDD